MFKIHGAVKALTLLWKIPLMTDSDKETLLTRVFEFEGYIHMTFVLLLLHSSMMHIILYSISMHSMALHSPFVFNSVWGR